MYMSMNTSSASRPAFAGIVEICVKTSAFGASICFAIGLRQRDEGYIPTDQIRKGLASGHVQDELMALVDAFRNMDPSGFLRFYAEAEVSGRPPEQDPTEL